MGIKFVSNIRISISIIQLHIVNKIANNNPL